MVSKFQKFMFDNFVIKTEEDEVSADEVVETEDIVEVIEPENTEETQEIEAVEFFAMPEEDLQVVNTEDIPEVISYSEEELQAAISAAKAEGVMQGREEALQEQNLALNMTITNVEKLLSQLVTTQEDLERNNEQKLLVLCKDILQKILPSLEEKHASDSIKLFLKEHFSSFTSSSKLAFYFHPEMASDMGNTIAKLANKYDFEGKISLHKDTSMELSDCRVEWEHGGVEKREHKILDKINDLLDNNAMIQNTENKDGK